eukprot:NODE_75_length_23373_cov_0.434261.p10 type:complete len:241 gc:universal NODE_75_length_23373_cov_0.434261:15622-16344(+)
MKFENLPGFDATTQNVYEHIVKRSEAMDTSESLNFSNQTVIDHLNTTMPSAEYKKKNLLNQVKELSKLKDTDVSTILAKNQHQKLEEMVEEIQKIQLQPTTKNAYLAFEDKLKALELKVGIEYIDVLPKLHAIEQAAKFVQKNEKLLANPQMVDLARAQSLSQVYQKYAPLKDSLPKLVDRLNIIKEGQLLTNINNQIVVQQTVNELKLNLSSLKESTKNLEKSISENQQMIKKHMENAL